MTCGTVAAALVLFVGVGYWTLRKGLHGSPGGAPPAGLSMDDRPGFPARQASESVAAVGSDIGRATRGWQLLLGVRVSSSGYPRVHAMVRYRERGQQGVEQRTFPTTFVACVSKAEMVGSRCNDEQDPPG